MAFSWKAVGLLLVVLELVVKAQVPGAPYDANLKDPKVKNALKWAVSEYNSQSSDGFLREVTEVIKAQEQVVSGMNYMFTVVMSSTSCKMGRVCTLETDPNWVKAYICDFQVWSQPWLNSIELMKNDCRIFN